MMVNKEAFFQEKANRFYLMTYKYILSNSDEVSPYMAKYIEIIRSENRCASERVIVKMHNEKFSDWFRDHVRLSKETVSDEVRTLAAQPDPWAKRFTTYTINELKFKTKKREERLNTQNSGVLLIAEANSFASTKDNSPVLGEVDYYGILNDIIEIRYSNDYKFMLFRCSWVDNKTGVRKDKFNYTLVNFNHLLYNQNRLSDEPYILASQAKQVWYVQDPDEIDWHVVMRMFPRNVYDILGSENEEDVVSSQQNERENVQWFDDSTPIFEYNDPLVISNEDEILVDIHEANDDERSDDEYEDAYHSEDYLFSEDDDSNDSDCDEGDINNSDSDDMDENDE